MGNSAVMVKAFEDINAAIAVLTAEATDARSGTGLPDADPLADLADGCLDILAGVSGAEARLAALKARAAAVYALTALQLAAPLTSPADAAGQEMAVRAEVACVLTIGERAAGALLHQAQMLTTTLPRTLAALRDGTLSWQHARVMVEEADTLDPAGAAALEAHFLEPDTLDPGRPIACPAGEMPAFRFRHKARIWRERHHAESIEKRHAKNVLDRRVEYVPDRDGMAWLSAYLPAHQARRSGTAPPRSPGGCRGPGSPAPSPNAGPTSSPAPS